MIGTVTSPVVKAPQSQDRPRIMAKSGVTQKMMQLVIKMGRVTMGKMVLSLQLLNNFQMPMKVAMPTPPPMANINATFHSLRRKTKGCFFASLQRSQDRQSTDGGLGDRHQDSQDERDRHANREPRFSKEIQSQILRDGNQTKVEAFDKDEQSHNDADVSQDDLSQLPNDVSQDFKFKKQDEDEDEQHRLELVMKLLPEIERDLKVGFHSQLLEDVLDSLLEKDRVSQNLQKSKDAHQTHDSDDADDVRAMLEAQFDVLGQDGQEIDDVVGLDDPTPPSLCSKEPQKILNRKQNDDCKVDPPDGGWWVVEVLWQGEDDERYGTDDDQGKDDHGHHKSQWRKSGFFQC